VKASEEARIARRSGQVAVILGASGGLGRGLANRFAAEGAAIVVSDIDEQALVDTKRQLTEGGADVLAICTDIAKPDEVDELARIAIDTFGRLDLVCNTVGVVVSQNTTWELPLEDWLWQMDVNFWGAIHVVRSFTPILIGQGYGHVANTASTVALTSVSGSAAYVASKHAVVSLCESLQQDLRAAGSSVKVSVIIPGAIRSRIYDSARNRQSEYGESRVSEAQRGESRQYLDEYGADPDVLAEIVLRQLDEGRFYVYGRESDIVYAEQHLVGLQQGVLPVPSFARTPGPGSLAMRQQSR